MSANVYICPHCQRKFPRWYWGVTGKAGGYGKVKKRSLATANFERHEEACAKRERNTLEKEAIDGN